MATITKYKTVQVPYTVATVSASHVSRLVGELESPRQVPTWGEHTTGSLAKRTVGGYDNGWGWEVQKGSSYRNDKGEYVWVNYWRNSQMSSGRIEIEAIKAHLEHAGYEVSEPSYTFRSSWRRDETGKHVDFDEENHVTVKVRKPEETFSGHCRTCLCEHAE
jgi:hypothetical protein